jgi:hypothetical protein
MPFFYSLLPSVCIICLIFFFHVVSVQDYFGMKVFRLFYVLGFFFSFSSCSFCPVYLILLGVCHFYMLLNTLYFLQLCFFLGIALKRVRFRSFVIFRFLLILIFCPFLLFARSFFLSGRLCGLVVRGPGSVPGATRFSEKQWVWNGVHSAS